MWKYGGIYVIVQRKFSHHFNQTHSCCLNVNFLGNLHIILTFSQHGSKVKLFAGISDAKTQLIQGEVWPGSLVTGHGVCVQADNATMFGASWTTALHHNEADCIRQCPDPLAEYGCTAGLTATAEQHCDVLANNTGPFKVIIYAFIGLQSDDIIIPV